MMPVDIVQESRPEFRTGSGTVGITVVRLGCQDTQLTVTLTDVTGGNFTLTVEDYAATANIAFDAAAAAVQSALEARVGAGNVVVTGNAGGPWTVTFLGTLASRMVSMIATDVNLEGAGHSIAVAVAVRGHDVGGEVKKYVMVRANGANDSVVMIGHTAAGVADGFILSAGQQSPPIYVDQLNKVYLIGGLAGQGYSWIAV